MGGFNMGGALGGAMGGASTGSMFGPWGTVIGAGLGAASGGMSDQGGGGYGVPGSPAQQLSQASEDQAPGGHASYAPPSVPSLFGQQSTPNVIPATIRDYMLRQLKGARNVQ